MRYSSPGHIPRSGDVILRRTNDASRGYTLCTSEAAPQIVCATYEEAIARADRFARSEHVDIWQTDDDRVFERVIEYRDVRSHDGRRHASTPA